MSRTSAIFLRVDQPSTGSSTSRGSLLREQIIAAALLLFARRGYSASISELAAAAGISRNQLFHYFPSKEQLGLAAVQRAGTLWHSELDLGGRMYSDPVERLRYSLRRLAELQAGGQWPVLALIAAFTLESSESSAPQQAAGALRDQVVDYFRNIFKEMKRDGRLSGDFKARPLALLVTAGLIGAAHSADDEVRASLESLRELLAP